MKKIAIRFDDFCETMDFNKFTKVISIVDKFGIKPLIGIVPNNLDNNLRKHEKMDVNEYSSYIQSLKDKGYLFAQHGFQHVYVNKKGGILGINKNSEFVGLTFEEQYNKIIKGKEMLENLNIDTNIFMAPSHSYDKNTIKALKKAGFKYVTDGYTHHNFLYKGLIFIPCMNVKYEKKRKGVYTICIHTNTIDDDFLKILTKLLEKNSKYIVDYNELLNVEPSKIFKLSQIFNLLIYKLKRKIKKIINIKK